MSKQHYKILILGGYGVFGGRLVQLLSDIQDIELVVAGRNLQKSKAFCARQTGFATFTPTRIDRADIAEYLRDMAPDLIVDASGPFQNYGDDPYDVVRAAINSRINYMDFADGADFVAGIEQFDSAAKNAEIFILSGVSSFPVLTAAIVRAIGQDIEIHDVVGGIAPSPYAGIGLNVMRAVIGYAGAPVKLQRNGQPATAIGLAESKNYTIAPPGMMPLRNIRFSLVDVPDLQALPTKYPEIRNIWIGAGPVPESLHRVLNLLAKTRALLRLPSFEVFSPIFYWVLNHMKFGEHRGGMFVEISGKKDGGNVISSWHMLAEGDDGPFIPSMAIEGMVRNILAGKSPELGARSAIDALELADYESLFENRTIYSGIRGAVPAAATLFQQNLASVFDDLPISLQNLHSTKEKSVWAGRANISRGKNIIANVIATIFRFPPSGSDVPTKVTVDIDKDGSEKWTRKFGKSTFVSHLRNGKGRYENHICESFGPITFALAMVFDGGRLRYIPRNWRFLGIPLPKTLVPAGQAFEEEIDGRFVFDVEISAPLIGRIVHYRGWLEPENSSFQNL